METLLQHLPLVSDVSGDGLEWQTEVKSPVLDVTTNPVQLWVSEFIFGVLLWGKQYVTETQCTGVFDKSASVINPALKEIVIFTTIFVWFGLPLSKE